MNMKNKVVILSPHTPPYLGVLGLFMETFFCGNTFKLISHSDSFDQSSDPAVHLLET